VQFYKKHINAFSFFFFLTVWAFALFLNWDNAFIRKMGDLLGKREGARILVYAALFLLFYYVFISAMKFYKLEQDINTLIRKEAMNDFLKRYSIRNKSQKNEEEKRLK